MNVESLNGQHAQSPHGTKWHAYPTPHLRHQELSLAEYVLTENASCSGNSRLRHYNSLPDSVSSFGLNIRYSSFFFKLEALF